MSGRERHRLTITLRKDLLPLVDDLVDGAAIRNRSHAIEYVLTQHLGPKIDQAVVLAGGDGVQLRPFTYEMPKAMIPVQGRPLIEHAVELLRKHGFRRLVISIGHLGEKIREHLGDGLKFGVHIEYVKQTGAAGTAGALATAKGEVKGTFLLYYADVLADLNLRDLTAFHAVHHGSVTAALTTVDDPSPLGAVRLHGAQVVEYIEKPKPGPRVSRLVSAGVYVMESDIFKELPNGTGSLERDVFPKLAKQHKLIGYPFEGQWFDVSTPESYERVIKEWQIK